MNNDNVGAIYYDASIRTDDFIKGANKIDKATSDLTGNIEKNNEKSNTSFGKMGVVIGAVSGVVSSVFTKAIDGITSSIGAAITRVDTLNNANRTFENMGFTATDTKKAMDDLKTSILGLPTSLDSAVSGVQLLAGSTQDVGKAQKVFTALNDAILGFGGSANQVQGAIIQVSQAFSNGKVDAQTWNSLIQNGAGPALNALAKTMGTTAGALKTGLSDGTISVQQFQDALIEMDNKGGGGMASFAKIAKDSTSGIGTGFDNARTAVVRGVADIIQSIGSAGISSAITKIGSAFEYALKDISKAVNFVKQNSTVFISLGAGIATAAASVVIISGVTKAYTAITIALSAVQVLQAQGLGVLRAAWIALTIAMNLSPVGIAITAIGLLTAAFVASTFQTNNTKTATDLLKDARDAAKVATDALKTSEDALKGAQFDAEGASLRAEAAQNNYNQAVKDYGPDSLEARQALHDMKGATDDLATANENVKNKTNDAVAAQQEIVKTKDAVVAALREISGATDSTAYSLANVAAQAQSAKNEIQKVQAAGGTVSAPTQLKAAGIPSVNIPHRAGGGSVNANSPYFVGDNKDGSLNSTSELFVPSSSGSIMNSSALEKALGSGNSKSSGNKIENNIGTINIADKMTADYFLRKLNGNQEIVSNGLTPAQKYA